MTYTFESCFAARIEDFIAQKNALGFGYLESSRLLRDFDRFCMTHFPEENFLTEELCLAWATKKNTEGNNAFRNRMMPVREFARYLNRNGEAAYVLPPDVTVTVHEGKTVVAKFHNQLKPVTDIPKTGDSTDLTLWAALAGASLLSAGAAAFFTFRKKKEGKHER